MKAYYYDNIECVLSRLALASDVLRRLTSCRPRLSRGDQRLPHNSGEDVTPERLQQLGLFHRKIEVAGRKEEEWLSDIGQSLNLSLDRGKGVRS